MDGGGMDVFEGKHNRKKYKVRIHPWSFALN